MCQSTFLLSDMPKQLFSKTFSVFFFAIFLVGSLFSLLGFNGIGSLEVRAEEIKQYPISNIQITEYQGAIALVVDGKFRGVVGCQNGGVLTGSGKSQLDINSTCLGVGLNQNGKTLQTGDTYDPNINPSLSYAEARDKISVDNYKVYTFTDGKNMLVDTKTGNYILLRDRVINANAFNLSTEESDKIKVIAEQNKQIFSLTGASVLGTKVTSGNVGILDTAKSKEAEISKKANATCKAILDATNKVIYECVDKEGKKVGLDGKPLADGNGGFTIDDKGNQIGIINQTVVDEAKKISTNTEAKATNQTNEQKNPINEGLGALFNIILTVISFIILALTYFAGWLAIGALWILGYLFLIFLRINPAGANFIAVAVDPWRIVVGIANMFVLSTFIFVGFGYILDIAKLKVKIEDFLLKIIVFTLILNFTLLGSASIVNVTQGIGEIMVGAYSIGETDPQKANFALINGLIEGMSRASVLRCGNLEWALDGNDKPSPKPPTPALKPGQTAPPSASESATGKDCDFGITGSPGQFGKLGATRMTF